MACLLPEILLEERVMIEIDEDLCKGCEICVAFCPKDVLEMSDKFNKKGVHPPRVAREEECNLCGNCMLYCPDLAVVVAEEGEGG